MRPRFFFFFLVPATALYFSIYEFTKRMLTGYNVPEVVSHLTAGSLGDLFASIFYVPSEVLKTRLQLQGRYNNPHFISGYNYRGTWHATKVVSLFFFLFFNPSKKREYTFIYYNYYGLTNKYIGVIIMII